MHKTHEDASRNIGIGNAGEVNEGRVAHHTTEGVEREERNNIRHEADAKAKGELPEMLCKTESAILEIVDGETRKEHCGTIESEDAPIGQGASRKVPVTEFTNGVHILLYFISCYCKTLSSTPLTISGQAKWRSECDCYLTLI